MLKRLEREEFIILLNQLNTIPLRLILYLENQADYDGWIIVKQDQIRDELSINIKQLSLAIEQLQKVDLVCVKDGELYLNYKVDCARGFFRINLNNAFEAIKSMHKRRLLLFYYFLLWDVLADWHTVEIERLFKNALFADSLLVSSFESFNDFMKNFVPLVEMGLLEVKLGDSNVILTKNTLNVKEQLYTFCGKEDRNLRKKWIRGKSDVHQLQIRVSEKILKDQSMVYATKRHNSMQDLEKIAMKYYYSIFCFDQDALEEVCKFKKEIYRQYGIRGISIYRESLVAFFEDELYEYRFGKLIVKREFSKIIKDVFFASRIDT